MSNSPKFTVIDLTADMIAAERAAAARRAAARRERQQHRDAAFQRLRAERAERSVADGRAAITARLAAVGAMTAAAPGDREMAAVAAEVAAVRGRVASAAAGDLAGYRRDTERLHEQAVAVSARADGTAAEEAGRRALLAALRERAAAPGETAARLDRDGYQRCADLLAQLDAVARDPGVRFEALRGTVEHAVAGYVKRGTEAAEAARVAQGEAADLLAALADGARAAVVDARDLHDDDLAREDEAALVGAEGALTAARADPALAAGALARARDLAAALPAAEARLDDLTAALERRAAFAETLKDVLAGHGMSFLGTDETKDRFILQFQRPDGAVYTAAVDGGEDDDLTLSYAIDGEADILVQPEPGQAVCDQTETFLEAIHADLAPSGYQAGELRWDGKPARPRGPRSRAVQAGPGRQQRTRREPS
jgi:hypothetical protein